MHTAHNLGLILPKSNSAKNNFFENITIKLFWRVDFPLPHGAKPLEARGEATSDYLTEIYLGENKTLFSLNDKIIILI